MKNLVPALLAIAGFAGAAHADIVITEVHASGSSNLTYGADFIELTNTGVAAVDITGWKIGDNSNSSALAVAFRGVLSIPAGASVVYFEGNATGTTDATITTSFISAWFGGTAPSGFLIGAYGGSGVGLSSTTDAVNVFDSGGNRVKGVAFSASTNAVSFDNAIGLGSTTLPLPIISTLSVAGVNNAFVSFNAAETGSPGLVPTPGAAALMGLGGLLATRRRRA